MSRTLKTAATAPAEAAALPSGTSTPASSTTTTDTGADLERLREAAETIGIHAHDGLSEIVAIAKMALVWMERPDGYHHPEVIAQALRTILGKAEDMESTINCEAASVGVDYVDPARVRRIEARKAARAGGAA